MRRSRRTRPSPTCTRSSPPGHKVAICEQSEDPAAAKRHRRARGRPRHHAGHDPRGGEPRAARAEPTRVALVGDGDRVGHRASSTSRPASFARREIDGGDALRARSSRASRRASFCSRRARSPRTSPPSPAAKRVSAFGADRSGPRASTAGSRSAMRGGREPWRARPLAARRSPALARVPRRAARAARPTSARPRRTRSAASSSRRRDAPQPRAPRDARAASAAARSSGCSTGRATPMGARLPPRWLLYPLLDPAAIGRGSTRSRSSSSASTCASAVQATLDGIGDLERLAGRIGARARGPRDLARARVAARTCRRGARRSSPARTRGARSAALRDGARPAAGASRRDRARRSSTHRRRTRGSPGIVRDGRAAEVDELRAIARDGKGWLAAASRRRERAADRASRRSRSATTRSSATTSRSRKPNLHARARRTTSGSRRSSAPSASSRPSSRTYEAKVLGAEERLRALELQLFDELLDAVAAHAADARRATAEALGATRRARRRSPSGAPRPLRAAARSIARAGARHRGGRHPVVEARAAAAAASCRTTLMLDPDAEQILVITGPNMAGKSTYLRQVALARAARADRQLRAGGRGARSALVDRIFTRVGASDNLVGGESTFMVEMRETAHILAQRRRAALVVLDEIGRGTSTFDGISIAWAVAEHLHDAPERPRTLFATHYHELTALAADAAARAELLGRGRGVEGRHRVPPPDRARARRRGATASRSRGSPACRQPVVSRARGAPRRARDGRRRPTSPARGAARSARCLLARRQSARRAAPARARRARSRR